MAADASVFLAWRYLRPRWSFVSVITFLSVLGPILGVAVLVVVTAVMNGFGEELREKIFGMKSHLALFSTDAEPLLKGEQPVIEFPEPMLARLREAGYRAGAVVEGPVLIQTPRDVTAKMVKGILPAQGQTIASLHDGMRVSATDYWRPRDDAATEPAPDGADLTLEPGEAVVGHILARRNGLQVGDKLVVHPTGRLKEMIKRDKSGEIQIVEPDEQYLPEEIRIVGLFSMGMYEYDSGVIITDLETADDLFLMDLGAASSIQVWTDDPFDLEELQELISRDPVFSGTVARTWDEINPQIFQALRVEKTMLTVLLFFIVLVAAFCIAATLITVVVQRTREIGILKAMGAPPVTVLSIFLLQGGMVGALGAGLGTALGLVLVRFRNEVLHYLAEIGIEAFPPELYSFYNLPARVAPSDLATIVVGSFLICIGAALLPALYAASRTPSDALRLEA